MALEALKGIKTIRRIARGFDVHPVKVPEWKRIMTEGATGVFGVGRSSMASPLAERDVKS